MFAPNNIKTAVQKSKIRIEKIKFVLDLGKKDISRQVGKHIQLTRFRELQRLHQYMSILDISHAVIPLLITYIVCASKY